MLEIKRVRKNVFPYRDLAPGQVFLRENYPGCVYYSYIDKDGNCTAVDLTNGEEANKIDTDERIECINSRLTLLE